MTAPHAPSQGVLSCLCPLPGKVSHWSPSQQATEDTLTTHPLLSCNHQSIILCIYESKLMHILKCQHKMCNGVNSFKILLGSM